MCLMIGAPWRRATGRNALADPTTAQTLSLSRAGDEQAGQALLVEVYDELRRIAAAHMRRERVGHTLQPTALAHEAFLRLVRYEGVLHEDRAHFLALAATCVRRILLEHARKRGAKKRGGGALRVTLVEELTPGAAMSELDVVELDDLLVALGRRNERQARVVELRFFGGQSVEDVASTLQVSPRTVKSDWRFARAWLRSRMTPGSGA